MGGFAEAWSLAGDGLAALTGSAGSGVAAWFLAAVFAVSGVGKIRRPALAAMAMVDFGVQRRVRPALGLALGLTEVALALALIVAPAPAGVVAAGLLWGFTLLIARSLRAGEAFACFCFGESDGALSRWTLLRTGALALVATALLVGEAPAARWSGDGPILELVAAAALFGMAVLARLVPNLLRWNRDLFASPEAARP